MKTSIAAMCLLFSLAAFAGEKVAQPVSVNLTSRHATGSVAYVRADATTNDYIECSVAVSSSAEMWCSAQDTSGNYIYCTSTNPQMIAAAQAVNGVSYINFWADANGVCTIVQVINGSVY